jgi:hypothetical protein
VTHLELTGEEIVTTLVMERNAGDRRLAIVVEGEEDCALIDVHLSRARAKTQMTGSKTAAVAAAKIVSSERLDWAVCVVDADFDRFSGRDTEWPEGMLATVNADLVVDAVVTSPNKIFGAAVTMGLPGEVMQFEDAIDGSLVDMCLRVSESVGALREAANEGDVQISLRSFPLSGVARFAQTGTELDLVVERAVERSGGRYSREDLREQVTRRLRAKPEGSTRYMNGHDFLAALRDVVDCCSKGSVSINHVAATCRVAISCDGFNSLQLIAQLRQWGRSRFHVEIFNCEAAA